MNYARNSARGVHRPGLCRPAFEYKLTRVGESIGNADCIDTPQAAIEYWQNTITQASWYSPHKEHLAVLLLNTRHNCNGHALVSIGTLNECIAHPRDIFGPVIADASHAFILMHNHPSGDSSPSAADRRLTRKIREGADIFEIQLLDHVIAGSDTSTYFSFKEMGLL